MVQNGEYPDNPHSKKEVDAMRIWCNALNITLSQFFRMPEEELKLTLDNIKDKLRLRIANNLIAYQKEKLEGIEKKHNEHVLHTVNHEDQWHSHKSTEPPRIRAGSDPWNVSCGADNNTKKLEDSVYSLFQPNTATQSTLKRDATLAYEEFQSNTATQSTLKRDAILDYASFQPCVATQSTTKRDGTYGYVPFQPHSVAQAPPKIDRTYDYMPFSNPTIHSPFQRGVAYNYGPFQPNPAEHSPRQRDRTYLGGPSQPNPATQSPSQGDRACGASFQSNTAAHSTLRQNKAAPRRSCIPVIKRGYLSTQRRSKESVANSSLNVYVEDSPKENVTKISTRGFMAGRPVTSIPKSAKPCPPPRTSQACRSVAPAKPYAAHTSHPTLTTRTSQARRPPSRARISAVPQVYPVADRGKYYLPQKSPNIPTRPEGGDFACRLPISARASVARQGPPAAAYKTSQACRIPATSRTNTQTARTLQRCPLPASARTVTQAAGTCRLPAAAKTSASGVRIDACLDYASFKPSTAIQSTPKRDANLAYAEFQLNTATQSTPKSNAVLDYASFQPSAGTQPTPKRDGTYNYVTFQPNPATNSSLQRTRRTSQVCPSVAPASPYVANILRPLLPTRIPQARPPPAHERTSTALQPYSATNQVNYYLPQKSPNIPVRPAGGDFLSAADFARRFIPQCPSSVPGRTNEASASRASEACHVSATGRTSSQAAGTAQAFLRPASAIVPQACIF